MKKCFTMFASIALGAILATALVACSSSESGCKNNDDCPDNFYCKLDETPPRCEPISNECTNKCGPAGVCPDLCANMVPAKVCNTGTWECVTPCTADCTNRECGTDPLCPTAPADACGTCGANETCSAAGKCGCLYVTCGATCCASGEACTGGSCQACTPNCAGLDCGPDPVCGFECGPCVTGTCDAGQCVGGSDPGAACPNGVSDCPDEWPTCLQGADLSYCTKECTTAADCGGENCCLEVASLSQSFCFDPTQCPGNGEVGDPCPFDGNVHADASNCGVDATWGDLVCLGLAPSADYGTCPGGLDTECVNVPKEHNPDCVNGICGKSFCAASCKIEGATKSCPTGFQPYDLSTACYCIPIILECTNPLDSDCQNPDQCCQPYSGSSTVCTDAGTCTTDQPCGEGICDCVCGHMCAGIDTFSCMQLCDNTAGTGCGENHECVGVTGIDRWGVCFSTPPCSMELKSADCPENTVCIIADGTCQKFECFFSGDKTEGQSCQYLNDCAAGLVCAGDPAVCTQICTPEGNECEATETCVKMQMTDGVNTVDCLGSPDKWGVCIPN